ncbi:MAG: glutathione S-transferase family protein [Bdellovibrionota bacterium]
MKTPDFELISFPLCPFVQRSLITLLHKKIPFRTTAIDLASPPAWFRTISPLGKVPLLRVSEPGKETVLLFESAVINEYLDEITPPSLQTKDPLIKARERAWIEASSELIMKMYQGMSTHDLADSQKSFQAMWEILHRLENVLPGGNYFRGQEFSLVDAAFAPFFLRLFAVKSLRAHESWNSLPKTKRWAESLIALPEVKNSVPADFASQYAASLAKHGSENAKEVA